jgi:LPXTG-motif cell wall-anchored protein
VDSTRRVLLGAGIAAVAVLLSPAPAHAAENAIAISVDGGPFRTSTVNVPVLGDVVVVPGDSATKTITIRNDGQTAGTLTAQLSDVAVSGRPDDGLASALRVGGRPAAELADGAALIPKTPLGVGQTVQIPLSYEFPVDATTGNGVTGASRVSFDVTLTLTATQPSTAGTGLLAATGRSVSLPAVVGGTIAVAAGAALLIVRRRRRAAPAGTSAQQEG